MGGTQGVSALGALGRALHASHTVPAQASTVQLSASCSLEQTSPQLNNKRPPAPLIPHPRSVRTSSVRDSHLGVWVMSNDTNQALHDIPPSPARPYSLRFIAVSSSRQHAANAAAG